MLFITYVSDIGLWIIGRALSAAMPPDDDDDDDDDGVTYRRCLPSSCEAR